MSAAITDLAGFLENELRWTVHSVENGTVQLKNDHCVVAVGGRIAAAPDIIITLQALPNFYISFRYNYIFAS